MRRPVTASAMGIKKKTHIQRTLVLAPGYGTKNIIQRNVPVSLPSFEFSFDKDDETPDSNED